MVGRCGIGSGVTPKPEAAIVQEIVAHAALTAALLSGATEPGPPDEELRLPRPTLIADVAVVGGATVLVTLLNPDVRRGVFARGSVDTVLENFRHPWRRAVLGARADGDGFFTNYVSHPVAWGMLGVYLRKRGYSRGGALLFSQVHSVAWEYVIEGSFQPPSGKDLVTNFVSSSVAIYVLYGLMARDRVGEEPPRVSLLLGPHVPPGPSGPAGEAGGMALGISLAL